MAGKRNWNGVGFVQFDVNSTSKRLTDECVISLMDWALGFTHFTTVDHQMNQSAQFSNSFDSHSGQGSARGHS